MTRERNTTIDFLKGLAVVLMILIHVTAYYTGNIFVKTIWNYAQIAVPLFVFCSAYLYFDKTKDAPFSFSYVFKRTKRLLLPYYLFVIAFFIFILFIQQEPLTLYSVQKWLLLQGDRDLNWLVVLFLYFLCIMPFIRFIEKKPVFFWTFGLVTFLSSVILFFYKIPVHFRYIMWLPWSLILFITALFVKSKQKTSFHFFVIISFIGIFALTRFLLKIQNNSLLLIDNKYPPNIYFLSYGMFLTFVLFLFHKVSLMGKTFFQSVFDFMSTNSYSIFFIHFLYLYLIRHFFETEKLQWWVFFIILTIISAGTQLLWNKISFTVFRH